MSYFLDIDGKYTFVQVVQGLSILPVEKNSIVRSLEQFHYVEHHHLEELFTLFDTDNDNKITTQELKGLLLFQIHDGIETEPSSTDLQEVEKIADIFEGVIEGTGKSHTMQNFLIGSSRVAQHILVLQDEFHHRLEQHTSDLDELISEDDEDGVPMEIESRVKSESDVPVEEQAERFTHDNDEVDDEADETHEFRKMDKSDKNMESPLDSETVEIQSQDTLNQEAQLKENKREEQEAKRRELEATIQVPK